MKILRLGNLRNGVCFPHDDICYFQSCHGHHKEDGYFRIDAMPYSAILHLLLGGSIEIVDATKGAKNLTDAQSRGVPTFCIVFNRALGLGYKPQVCTWQTEDMIHASKHKEHKKLVQTIRKLVLLYGYREPAIIGDNVFLTCHNGFSANDKSSILRNMAKIPGFLHENKA